MLALYGAPTNFCMQKCSAIELVEKYRLRMYTMAATKSKRKKKDIDFAKLFPTVDEWNQHQESLLPSSNMVWCGDGPRGLGMEASG